MTKKKKFILIIALIVFLLSLSALGIYLIVKNAQAKSFIAINGYYDENGDRITGTQQAVIGNVEGIKYITLEVKVLNKDTVPLNLKILDASPLKFKNALLINQIITTQPNQYATWNSSLIDIQEYEGTTQTFSVTAEASSTKRNTTIKQVSISIPINPNPQSQFDIIITPNVENTPDIDPSCTEAWSCGSWSSCSNNQQTRVCTDLNNCGTTLNKPPVIQSCTSCSENWLCSDWGTCINSVQIRTCNDQNNCGTLINKPATSQACVSQLVKFKSTDTNYNSNTRIALDQTYTSCGSENLVEYSYDGYSSSSACTGVSVVATLMTVPGGYPLVQRTGYAITERVYVYKGNNCYIFAPSSLGGISLSSTSTNPSLEVSC